MTPDQFAAELETKSVAIHADGAKSVRDSIGRINRGQKERAPVETGELAGRGIRINHPSGRALGPMDLEADSGTYMQRGRFVEFGADGQPPQPWAFDDVEIEAARLSDDIATKAAKL